MPIDEQLAKWLRAVTQWHSEADYFISLWVNGACSHTLNKLFDSTDQQLHAKSDAVLSIRQPTQVHKYNISVDSLYCVLRAVLQYHRVLPTEWSVRSFERREHLLSVLCLFICCDQLSKPAGHKRWKSSSHVLDRLGRTWLTCPPTDYQLLQHLVAGSRLQTPCKSLDFVVKLNFMMA